MFLSKLLSELPGNLPSSVYKQTSRHKTFLLRPGVPHDCHRRARPPAAAGCSNNCANNRNPRRPICRPAPLFRLPPPPQLMMIARSLSLSPSRYWYLFCPSFIRLIHCPSLHYGRRGSIRIRRRRRRLRMGRRKLGLRRGGGRGDGRRVYCWRDLLRSGNVTDWMTGCPGHAGSSWGKRPACSAY